MGVFGFVGRGGLASAQNLDTDRESRIQNEKLKQLSKIRQKEEKAEASRQIASQRKTGLTKFKESLNRGTKEVSGYGKGFGNQFKNISKAVQGQDQSQFQNNRQQVIIQQRFEAQRQQALQEQQRPRNFFAHSDPIDVYGSDELTFFDSNKQRGADSTGSMFGI